MIKHDDHVMGWMRSPLVPLSSSGVVVRLNGIGRIGVKYSGNITVIAPSKWQVRAEQPFESRLHERTETQLLEIIVNQEILREVRWKKITGSVECYTVLRALILRQMCDYCDVVAVRDFLQVGQEARCFAALQVEEQFRVLLQTTLVRDPTFLLFHFGWFLTAIVVFLRDSLLHKLRKLGSDARQYVLDVRTKSLNMVHSEVQRLGHVQSNGLD
mmetsp:Transcript_2008/g.4626  ORF Transcript_2008/g.4626 Transcript_2008/m.4626 type:complete len:214 (+) Transcript_2008:2675-3316(+)